MKTTHLTRMALLGLMGFGAVAGCSAPPDGGDPEVAKASSEALTAGTISATSSWATVTVTGSGFTPSSWVFVGTYNRATKEWTGAKTVTSTTGAPICIDGFCRPPIGAGLISAQFQSLCNSDETVYAIDDSTGAYANQVELDVHCL